LISTPNILNVFSQMRFLFTGFLRGRVRPVHTTKNRERTEHLFNSFLRALLSAVSLRFRVVELRKTRVKFAPIFFTALLYPWMRLFGLATVIRAEKDPVQRLHNRQVLTYMFHPALLLSDNIVVLARKITDNENRPRP
jgi:hypothetical protein